MWNSFNENQKNANLTFFIGSFLLSYPVPCLNTLTFFGLFLDEGKVCNILAAAFPG